MVIDDGTAYVTGGVYREIVQDEKLVFTWGATDGWPKLDPEALDESPLVTVTLSQISGKTEMTLHVELPASLSEAEVHEWLSLGIQNGWRGTVDRLAAIFASASVTVYVVTTTAAPTAQLLAWIAERSRSYDETIEVWKTSCPRLSVWARRPGDGLVRIDSGHVLLTTAGTELLAASIAPRRT